MREVWWMGRAVLVGLAAGAAAAALPATAQERPTTVVTAGPADTRDTGAGVPRGSPQSLSCPDCNPRRNGFWAFGELMIVQAIPLSFNNIKRGAIWAKISPDTWYDNLQYPWQWDDNHFLNNQFSHPYHGNLYFNAARTNGFGFWASAPWAFGGSLMWELFGEAWAPAPNDLWNTSLGGIALGEMTYRLSSLVLDNTATGPERVVREVGATLLNPIRGFNRLIRGESGRVSQTPPDWRPSFIQGALEVGYRRIGNASDFDFGSDVTSEGAFLKFRIRYGNPLQDLTGKPFSHFEVVGELASKKAQNESRSFSTLTATGTLGGVAVAGDKDNPRQAIAGLMKYEYYSNPAVDWGGQSLRGGWVGLFGNRERFSTQIRTMASFYPISAIRSDYFATEEGRNYDYGVSTGGHVDASFVWYPRAYLTLGYSLIHQFTIDGANSQHTISTSTIDLKVLITRALGVGATYTNYRRWSRYDTQPAVNQVSPVLYLYAGMAIPSIHSN